MFMYKFLKDIYIKKRTVLKGVQLMKRMLFIFVSSFLLIALAACAQGKETKSELDYDQTKKMIVDILKTDQGKKAIQDVLTDEK